MKIFISLLLLSLSSFALELPWSNQFREPNAILTKFTDTEDYDLVEDEREGPGWRYFYGDAGESKNIIIFNHPGTLLKHDYKKAVERKFENMQTIADWFANNNAYFYAPLKKRYFNTNIWGDEYERNIVPLELFHHFTNLAKSKHGPNANLCYVGTSSGGASVLFASTVYSGHFVSISPEARGSYGKRYNEFSFIDYGDNRNAKNLTVLIGANELKTIEEGAHDDMVWDINNHPDPYQRIFRKTAYAERFAHFERLYSAFKDVESSEIKVEVTKEDLNHQQVSRDINIHEWGEYVLKGCGFK